MPWSFRLLTVRGIPIRVHVSFLLVLIWAAWLGLTGSSADWLRGMLFMVAFILLLFVCVVLHELGHSLAAQLFGVRVEDITLWPVGGVARMAQMPRQPYQEFLITAAGPAVNIFLAFGLGALAFVLLGPDRLLNLALSPARLNRTLSAMSGESLLLLLLANNVILALFNLIPAFPMDGGRLLRAILAVVLPFPRATQWAAGIGQVLALLLGSVGLITGNYLLALVALFVFLSAGQERGQTLALASLQGLQVRQAMQPPGLRLHPAMTAGEAAALIATSPQAAFLVVDEGRLIGVLTRPALLATLRKPGPQTSLSTILRRDCARLSPDMPLSQAQERLAGRQGGVGLVVEDGRVIGLLTTADLGRLAELMEVYPAALPHSDR